MADREAQQKLYAYGEMSNKVQQADRSSRRFRPEEGTGEVESLRNRSDIGRMGDRITSNSTTTTTATTSDDKSSKRSAEVEEIMERAKKKRQKREQASGGTGTGKKRRAGESILMSSGGQSILDMGELDVYQPTHAGSRASYENLLVSFSFFFFVLIHLHASSLERTNVNYVTIFCCAAIHNIECDQVQKLSWQSAIVYFGGCCK